MRTCRWCGKQYDEMKHPGANYHGCCSTRCMNALDRSKQQERDRKDRERERQRSAEKRKYAQSVQKSSGSPRQNSSNTSNGGCGLNVGEWLIIIVLFFVGLFIYSKCSDGNSSSTTDSDTIVENKVGAEKKKEQEITIEEQQMEEDFEVIDSCLMDSIEESPCIDSLEVEEWELQEVTNDSVEVTP